MIGLLTQLREALVNVNHAQLVEWMNRQADEGFVHWSAIEMELVKVGACRWPESAELVGLLCTEGVLEQRTFTSDHNTTPAHWLVNTTSPATLGPYTTRLLRVIDPVKWEKFLFEAKAKTVERHLKGA